MADYGVFLRQAAQLSPTCMHLTWNHQLWLDNDPSVPHHAVIDDDDSVCLMSSQFCLTFFSPFPFLITIMTGSALIFGPIGCSIPESLDAAKPKMLSVVVSIMGAVCAQRCPCSYIIIPV